jgi:hypothetical protein
MYVQTTLVKYILEEQHGHRIAVILNEFGEETGIESAFVQDGQVCAAAVNAAGLLDSLVLAVGIYPAQKCGSRAPVPSHNQNIFLGSFFIHCEMFFTPHSFWR